MMNENTTAMEIDETPAKAILEKTDALLDEIRQELRGIEEAIFSPQPRGGIPPMQEQDTCLLNTLKRQNNAAQELLEIAAHIRRGLW